MTEVSIRALAEMAQRIVNQDKRITRLETLEFSSASGGGAWVEIETITVDAPVTTISFLDIPQKFLHLAMIFSLRGTGTDFWLATYMRLNNDSSDHYWYQVCKCSKGSAEECAYSCDNGFPTKESEWLLFYVSEDGDGEGNDPDCFLAGHLWMPDYRNQYKKTSAVWDALGTGANVGEITRQIYRADGGGVWHVTDPVTRIDVFVTTDSLAKNSKISLFGIQGTFEEFA